MIRKRILFSVITVLCLLFSIAVFAACGDVTDDNNPPCEQAVLESLEIGGSFKTRYVLTDGQDLKFDNTGMKVYACYSDGTKTELKGNQYELSVIETSRIKITYENKSATHSITVGKQSNAKSETVIKSEFTANKRTFTDTANGNFALKYCVREPDNTVDTEKVPLVLFLHGAGERGDNNEDQLKNAIAKAYSTRFDSMFYDSYVIAPQCPYINYDTGATYDNDPSHMNINASKWVNRLWTQGSYSLAETPETPALKAAANLVKEYLKNPRVDASRVYVIGISMGGYGTWDVIARYPEIFAAAVPICGGGPSEKSEELADMPIYAFHGTADTAVPYDKGTKAMYDNISAYGKNKMLFHTFEKGGHSIWDQAITYTGDSAYPSTLDWLFAQNSAA